MAMTAMTSLLVATERVMNEAPAPLAIADLDRRTQDAEKQARKTKDNKFALDKSDSEMIITALDALRTALVVLVAEVARAHA